MGSGEGVAIVVAWRVILVLVLATGMALLCYEQTMLSLSASPSLSDTPVAVSQASLVVFYAGFVASALPGGRLAERFGGKQVADRAVQQDGLLCPPSFYLSRVCVRFVTGKSL